MNAERLETLILDAHERGDSENLARYYFQAAQIKDHEGNAEAAGFLLTQAYVFALESGLTLADEIRAELVCRGREEP